MSDDIPYYERPDTIEDGDIVERLRRYTVACRCKGCLTKIAAADEIERLRAEVANVRWQLDFANDCLSKASGLLAGED